jgi:hypothetical protein
MDWQVAEGLTATLSATRSSIARTRALRIRVPQRSNHRLTRR